MRSPVTGTLAVLSVLLSLTGCGGGGGGSSSVSSSAPVTNPPTPIPISFQAPSTTVAYDVSSASASVGSTGVTGSRIDDAGTGSTVTVVTDASGNLSSVRFNIATPTQPFTNTYSAANLTAIPLLSLTDLAVLLNAAVNTPGANGFTTATSGLSVSTFGIWAANDNTSGRIGVFAGGTPTPVAAMPTTGTATYNGTTIGAAASSSAAYALAGNAQLVANFSTNTVNTTISNLQFENVSTNQITAQPNLTGTASITGNQYKGPLAGGTLSGTSTGTFYGPSAQETAGVWRVSGGGVTAIGSYGAKK